MKPWHMLYHRLNLETVMLNWRSQICMTVFQNRWVERRKYPRGSWCTKIRRQDEAFRDMQELPCGQNLGLTGGGNPDLDSLEGAVWGSVEHRGPLMSHLAPPPSLGGPLRLPHSQAQLNQDGLQCPPSSLVLTQQGARPQIISWEMWYWRELWGQKMPGRVVSADSGQEWPKPGIVSS